jgi:hypothetical protein
MHFEILIEDISGKRALEILIPKILNGEQSYRIISYKGIGHIPKGMKRRKDVDVRSRLLLNKLPHLIQGYGRSLSYNDTVVVVCDLDRNCQKEFRNELLRVWNSCNPAPKTQFCIAVEEMEAWYLGDIPAIKAAYPKAKNRPLESYSNDTICGTWEVLADAIYLGGSAILTPQGYQKIGEEKSKWAERITPHMDVEKNASPSFCYFRDKLRDIAGIRQ